MVSSPETSDSEIEIVSETLAPSTSGRSHVEGFEIVDPGSQPGRKTRRVPGDCLFETLAHGLRVNNIAPSDLTAQAVRDGTVGWVSKMWRRKIGFGGGTGTVGQVVLQAFAAINSEESSKNLSREIRELNSRAVELRGGVSDARTYKEYMGTPGVFASGVEVEAAANQYGVCIVLHSGHNGSTKLRLRSRNAGPATPEFHILLSQKHFVYLKPKQ